VTCHFRLGGSAEAAKMLLYVFERQVSVELEETQIESV
jgi:hypothetical protein